MFKPSRLLPCAVVGLLFVLAGCGSGGENGAPSGSTLEMSPTNITWTEDGNTTPIVLRQPFTITLRNGGGIPLANTEVQVFLDLSPGAIFDLSGTGLSGPMLLYDDGLDPVVSTFSERTDANGNIRVFVDFVVGGGSIYKGSLQAFSGSAYQNAEINVECTDTNDTTTACD